jgi:sigma-B regulation protein RsbU (phosphoserine phosphatase)
MARLWMVLPSRVLPSRVLPSILLILAASAPGMWAQGLTAKLAMKPGTFDATRLTAPRVLGGTWLIHAGDDPSYADPALDDSAWTAFNLQTPLPATLDGARPAVVWYRLKIQVDPTQTGIALREETLARAFEIYVNGERIMALGQFAPFRPYTFTAPILAPIPDRMVATGQLQVALRVGFMRQDWYDSNPGLADGNLVLGPQGALADKDWLEIIGENSAFLLDSILEIAVGFVALALFISQRRHLEYLWISCLGMLQVAQLPVRLICYFQNVPIGWRFLIAAFTTADPYVLVAMYFAFVGRRIRWKFRIFLVIAGLLNGYSILTNQGLVPTLTGSYGLLVNMPFVILLAIVIPIVLGIDWRRGNREAGILLIPAMFFSLFIYADYTLALLLQVPAWKESAQRGLSLIQRFPAGPFAISLNDISGIASTLALAIIMVLRSSTISRRQAVLEGELAAAAEVQQVMLPEQIETIPGFSVESAYAPAQQVGGDFFQILPAGDGGLLLILGDVAGKGLPAAMLVSVLVGAIRTVVNFTEAPDEILANLNERLIGRSRGGFSTALAAHFSAGGVVTIANAGQLSPYIDGVELELPGALPLGILSGTVYEAIRFELAPGSRMTFYSDGVIEAQNAQGDLFGFDRGKEISTQPASTIVNAAKLFGQSDDITVVAITRNFSAAAATAA